MVYGFIDITFQKPKWSDQYDIPKTIVEAFEYWFTDISKVSSNLDDQSLDRSVM